MSHEHTDGDSSTGAVWYISKYLALPGPSGVGTRGFNLVRELASLGRSVVIVTSDSNHLTTPPKLDTHYLVQKIDGVPVYWVRTLKYKSVRSVRRMLSWLHFERQILRLPFREMPRPSVIIASSLSLTTVLTAAFLCRRYGAKLVFEVRDIWPLTLTEEGGFTPVNPLIRLLAAVERFGYRHADVIVGTMPNLQAHVRSVSKSEKPVFCIPMGYETSAVNPSPALPEEYLDASIPDDRFLVGYAGSIGATNALETLFECAEQLAEDDSVHFVVVGDGDLRRDFIDRYGKLPNITFVGRIPRESVQGVLARFDVLYLSAHPSEVWKYGQSLNKLIDYMLAAKPVIASYTGFPSMINEAECGYFVPSGDAKSLKLAILKVKDDSAESRSEMGQRGRAWLLENRSYPELARRYLQILADA